jgi:hypothetical protein
MEDDTRSIKAIEYLLGGDFGFKKCIKNRFKDSRGQKKWL